MRYRIAKVATCNLLLIQCIINRSASGRYMSLQIIEDKVQKLYNNTQHFTRVFKRMQIHKNQMLYKTIDITIFTWDILL